MDDQSVSNYMRSAAQAERDRIVKYLREHSNEYTSNGAAVLAVHKLADDIEAMPLGRSVASRD